MRHATLPMRTLSQWMILAVTACLAVFVWEAVSDEPPEADQPHRVPVALLDVAKAFKQYDEFNAGMIGIKAEVDAFDKEIRAEQSEIQRLGEAGSAQGSGKTAEEIKKIQADLQAKIAAKKQRFLADEAQLYFDSYERISEVVGQIAAERDIGIVLRNNTDAINPADRNSVLQGVNRAVIHSNAPDLTKDVLAVLNGRKAPNS